MIKIFHCRKMLRNFVIVALCFVGIRASGEFSVLSSPKSISFKGNDVLQSQYVGDVLYAAMGNAVGGDAQWAGMTISDPFNLAKGVIAVIVDGASHINVDTNAKTYSMEGSSSDESLNAMSSELEASNVAVCDVNFNDFEEGVSNYRTCFGDVSVAAIQQTKNLNPSLHSGDKQFLQSVAFVHSAAENLTIMQKASNILIFRLYLGQIAKAHGEKSAAMLEASKLIAAAISKLNAAAQKSSNSDVLVVAIANKSVGGRSKREVIPGTPGKNNYNLAEYYNEDYPVIFNIILWFMVTFGFALLAICYAIGSMDPGRDSIIYRMTSTRMKKDN